MPDLLICCNGVFIGAEIKAPKGTPSELQLWNLRKIDESGGFGWLLYPKDFEHFKDFINAVLAFDEIAKEIYEERRGW